MLSNSKGDEIPIPHPPTGLLTGNITQIPASVSLLTSQESSPWQWASCPIAFFTLCFNISSGRPSRVQKQSLCLKTAYNMLHHY